MNMDLKETLSKLGIDSSALPEYWVAAWPAAAAGFAERPDMYFLNPQWIKRTALELQWPADITGVLLEHLKLFDDYPELRLLAWYCRQALFVNPPEGNADAGRWPLPPADLHPAVDMFYAYVFLAGVPYAMTAHERAGVPVEITRATLADLPLWLNNFKQKHGRWGLDQFQRTGWLYGHLRARLFRLGRLQFQFEQYKYQFQAYQSRLDGRVIALAGNGEQFRPDGRYEGAGGIHAGAAAWTATLAVNNDHITGFPVDVRGIVRREPLTLKRADWQPVLMPDDPVLGVHIPAGGGLSMEVSGDSFRQAAEFFPKHFPESKWRVFTCTTWFFDPQFEQYLAPDANIVQFQKQFYLLPVPRANARQAFERVCGIANLKPEEMPRKTSLQRAVADHVAAGGQWYITAGFMLKDHVPHWGNAGV